MSHFAKVVDGYVINVIVAEEDFFDSHVENEPCDWIKTSYNIKDGKYVDPDTGEPMPNQEQYINDDYPERNRGQYAVIDMVYDREHDLFYQQKEKDRASWRLNYETAIWEPPIPKPETPPPSGYKYIWNEDAYVSDNTEGWDLVRFNPS
jgi:hypothetical protein